MHVLQPSEDISYSLNWVLQMMLPTKAHDLEVRQTMTLQGVRKQKRAGGGKVAKKAKKNILRSLNIVNS